MTDEQDVAEALDEDVVDEVDDRSGDAFGEALPGYPPDRPLGVGTVGVTPVEEDAGESFAERTWREEPDEEEVPPQVGQLVDLEATTEDREERALAEEVDAVGDESAEELALHIETDDDLG